MHLASILIVILISLNASSDLLAQHDIQRNAVREIALGKYDKVTKTLSSGKKPDSGPAETLYVEMLSLLAQDKIEEAKMKANAARSMGLSLGRYLGGPRDLLSKLPKSPQTKDLSLVHGPMIGNLAPAGASFWVRTNKEVLVSIIIDDLKASARTTADNDFTTVVRLEGLSPDKKYSYILQIDGKPVEIEKANFSTPPAIGKPSKFAVGFGGGGGFIPKWEYMWDTIRNQNPIAFLMLGDNVYIDDPEHDLTNHYCYSRRQSRPEWRRLTSSTAMYSIWDDHDFGLNDCIPGPEINKPAWKRRVWEIYKQNWVNPSYGGGSKQPGCWYDFKLGDVHFMMLDGRYYRDLKGGSMLGQAQKEWLKKTLSESNGTFKIIASPVPFSPNIKPGSKDPWDGFPEERAEIFSWIKNKKIEGVFLVAADRHRSDLRTIENSGSYKLYEFESSRLTNRHTHPVVKTKGLVWGYNKTCSFGFMRFDTTLDDPEVRFEVIDIDGNKQEEYVLKRSKLE